MKTKLVVTSIAVIGVSIGLYMWMHAETIHNAQTSAQIAQTNNAIPTAAGQNQAQPAVTQPPATTVKPSAGMTGTVPATQPPVTATKEQKPEKAKDLSPEELADIRKELKDTVDTKFKDKLSFPLDETKMIAYAYSSLRVKKINNKWDVQIAGADKDATAIEYNNLAVEEITKSLQSMQGLTVDQYNEMTKLSATDAEFNRTYQLYKQLLEEGIIPSPVVATTAAVPSAPVTAPIAPNAVTKPGIALPVATKPVVAPVAPGTAPAIPGSPARPYSPPLSR